MRVALALACTLAGTACYTYRPLPNVEPAPGEFVRADLTAEGTQELARVLGPHITQLEGRLDVAPADTVRLLVRVARTPDGIESYFKDDPVSLARTSIASLSQRKLSAGPTAAIGGVLVGGAILAATALSGGAGDSRNPGAGPVDPE